MILSLFLIDLFFRNVHKFTGEVYEAFGFGLTI